MLCGIGVQNERKPPVGSRLLYPALWCRPILTQPNPWLYSATHQKMVWELSCYKMTIPLLMPAGYSPALCQIKKELLSVVALTQFHQYTYGCHVTVHNDHKPLVVIQQKPIAKASAHLQHICVLERLADYDYTIIHLPSKGMHLANALSCALLLDNKEEILDSVNVVTATDPTLTSTELKDFQQAIEHDTWTCQLMATIRVGWPTPRDKCLAGIIPYWDFRDYLTTCDSIIIKRQAILIPKHFGQKYIQLAHEPTKGLTHAYNGPVSLCSGLAWQ